MKVTECNNHNIYNNITVNVVRGAEGVTPTCWVGS